MPIGSEQQRENHLISVLHSHALEHSDVNGAMQSINKMISNNAREIDYILALADGLKYGNWPWSQPYNSNQKFPSMQKFVDKWCNDPNFCIHANENPNFCPCDEHCYCKSNTCKDKK